MPAGELFRVVGHDGVAAVANCSSGSFRERRPAFCSNSATRSPWPAAVDGQAAQAEGATAAIYQALTNASPGLDAPLRMVDPHRRDED